jgi:AbrB family looped-hinge helix DNA binding protein
VSHRGGWSPTSFVAPICGPEPSIAIGHEKERSAPRRNVGGSRWYPIGMRATIDKAGRLVIPKPLRDRLGLVPGEVEVAADGNALRVESLASEELQEEDGRLVIAAAGVHVNDDTVRSFRDSEQK